MLRAKDMIFMLLYGLEMFLGVCGMSSNSSKLQMARGAQICAKVRASDLPTTIGCTDAHASVLPVLPTEEYCYSATKSLP